MSSILTNSSAMVALQTLKSINSNLAKTQSEISTGKAVASAKDNSAVWAISKVMEADVNGFTAISDSLSLGESTVAVARQATETVTDLLTQMKGKIVAAQEENVDREKIQTDIAALRNQIASVVGAAQFNGLNMVQGSDDVNILSSLDRASDGSVTASNITVARQDMTTGQGTFGTGASLAANGTASAAAVANTANTAIVSVGNTWANNDVANLTVAGVELAYTFQTGDSVSDVAAYFEGAINGLGLEGISASSSGGDLTISTTRAFEEVAIATAETTAGDGDVLITTLNGTGSLSLTSGDIAERAESIAFSTSAAVNEGDSYKVTIGSASYDYIAGAGESMEDVAKGLKIAVDSAGNADLTTRVVQDSTTGAWSLKVDNNGSSAAFSLSGNADGEASGGLFGLSSIDVTTSAGATAALDNIETFIDNAIDASASFGSAQGRIETQNDFIGKLTDSLKSGIGSLVDADMEAASARLQALQVQQQLGTQALSIANQAPQNILSLFR
ncbi:flagellin [Maritimibacter fusiformis]|uniref:Flagellin n=1 Tax=Maritimibacter fusiformis TaxID=2603819 RepID=A0A5D0RAL1_9RHOB|nr:flagellin [Maritimibacter fusiformis]TYB77906.1 flagellin [Maritimibacter fusiformis]